MSEPGPTFRDRLEFAAYRLAAGVLRVLPEPVALSFGAVLGWLGGSVLRIRRGVVMENLRHAFPEWSEARRRRVGLASYRHLGREAAMTFRLGRASAAGLLARAEVVGLDEVLAAHRRHRGFIIVTGHLGNWELGGAVMAAHGVPVDAVAFRQRNRLFDRELVENRGRLGMRIIYRIHAGKGVLRSLGEGRVPALVADQNAGSRGIFVDFLGRPASTARGPALFALRSGKPLVAGICVAKGGRPRRYVVYLEPLEPPRSGDLERDVLALTQAHADVLARYVKRHPEQYFWQHKRWKTRPPDRNRPSRTPVVE